MTLDPEGLSRRLSGIATVPAGVDSNERALLAGVVNRDRKAMAEFVARYTDSVYAYVARRLAPRRDLVEDVVHEVFLAGLRSVEQFAGDAPVRSWLLGIARHKVEDHYRARLRETHLDDAANAVSDQPDLALPDVGEAIDRERVSERTRLVLDLLPETYAIVLQWRYWEERSTREIAALARSSPLSVEPSPPLRM